MRIACSMVKHIIDDNSLYIAINIETKAYNLKIVLKTFERRNLHLLVLYAKFLMLMVAHPICTLAR